MEPAEHLDVLRRGADALLAASAGALERPVPGCPEWTIADLVGHVGTTWGWAAEIVTTGQRATRTPEPPAGSETALLGWARERADLVLAALGAADPDADCWTFGLPRSRRFWFRRQALETTLHARDAQEASGPPAPVDPEVAADGVDEYVTVMIPRWVSRRPEGWDGQTVHLHRTDGDGEWLVRLGPDGTAQVERSHGKGDLAVRGPAEALWLWTCNRAGLDEQSVEVFGDRDLAARWTSEISF